MSLEEKRLDQVTLKLKQINQEISDCEQRQRRVRADHVSAMSEPDVELSIAQLTNLSNYSNAVSTRVQAIEQKVQALNTQQTELLDQVAEHRAKIKGWQILIDKLRREDADAEAKVAMMAADDRFLRDVSRIGNSK
jgi:flagellar biosynthesis chaperone FliJ